MVEKLLPGCAMVGIQIILAMSVNMISGYARQLSLGQAAFAALGAYTAALLHLRLGWSFWIACPLSVGLTGVIGGVIGLPVLRMRKYYVLVMTLSATALVQHVLRGGRFAGGYFGLGQIAPPHAFGISLESGAFLPVVLVALGCCLGADYWFRSSRFGKLLRHSTMEDNSAVFVAFVLSTMMAGLAGSLFAFLEAFISPFDFTLEASLFALALAAGGGLGAPQGAILGAVVFGGTLEIVRSLVVYRLLLTGVILLLVGRWFPGGLLTLFRRSVPQTQSVFSWRPSDQASMSD